MSMLSEISLPFSPVFCWLLTMCLIHTFWQGIIIAFLVALVVRQKLTAHQKFATAFSLLVLTGLLPLCNYAWLARTSPLPPVVERAGKHFSAEGLSLFELGALDGRHPSSSSLRNTISSIGGNASDRRSPRFESGGPVVVQSRRPVQAGTGNTNAQVPGMSLTLMGSIIITTLYLMGVLVMILRLGFAIKSHWELSSVCKQTRFADQVPQRVRIAAERAARSLGRKLRTPIALFRGEGAALVVGCVRPVILVNASLISGLTPLQLEQVLAHELAHIYRFDPLTQFIQRLVESVLFFHPGVWYISRTVSDLREFCCDELAAQHYSRVDFASTLVQCAVLARRKQPTQLTLAATGSRSNQLTSRIDALLQSKNSRGCGEASQRSDASVARRLTYVLLGAMLVLATIRGISKSNGSLLPFPDQRDGAPTAASNPVVLTNLDWQWITEERDSVRPSQFLFGGKQLRLSNTIPQDIEIQVEINDVNCKFAQWHFGDSSSTRVAILIEMVDGDIHRLFIDRNRDRIIEDNERVTVKTKTGKTWLTKLETEVHENETVVRAARQIGITPSRDRTKIRITTLGFAEGNVEVGKNTFRARRVDKNGDGLPTGKTDQIWIDFDHNGQFDKLTERMKLDSILRINDARYMVRSDRLGQSIALTPDDQVGFVRFHFELTDKTATLETFEGSLRDESGMLIAVGLHEKQTPVPVGRYCLQDLVIQVRDKDNAVWRMTLSRGLSDNWRKINPDWIIDVKKESNLEMQLLEDLDFSFVAEHVDKPHSLYKTELNPEIRTKNGLVITDFTKETPNEVTTFFDNSVIAKFTARDATEPLLSRPSPFASRPDQCSSSFG